jgi:hypothetical protein
VPRAAGLGADGGGYPYSPFYDARVEELDYCKKVKDWWGGVVEKKRKEDEGNIVVQIGGGPLHTSEGRHGKVRREHRLICDAGVHVEPNGFFDCTVEVRPSCCFAPDVTGLYMFRLHRFCTAIQTITACTVST